MIGKPDIDGYYHPITKEKAFELASISIDECDFTVRSFHVLKRAQIENLLALAILSEEDLFKFKNCGKGSIQEMKSCLKKHGVPSIPVCVFESEQEEIDKKINPNPNDVAQATADVLELLKTIKVEDAELSVRSYNCLVRFGIKTLYDFAILSMDEALQIPNLGRRSIKEITNLLKTYGLDYPLEHIDLSDLHPSLKYVGLSDEALTLLNNSGIKLLDDLAALSDEQLYELLSICSEMDSLRIIYFLSTVREINLGDEYFDSYLHFSIKEIAKNLKKTDYQILSMSFGLFGEKTWPITVLSSSLALSENQMESLINNILSVYLVQGNYLRIKPLIQNYLNKGEKTEEKNGYLLLIKRIIELKGN
ncbi:MAG: hypothetical protein J5955_03300 [Bacilli bacterium]|nr:hypothetical protein [Bacilli bacterium]